MATIERMTRLLLYFVVGAFLGGAATLSFAETIVATRSSSQQPYILVPPSTKYFYTPPWSQSNANAACAAAGYTLGWNAGGYCMGGPGGATSATTSGGNDYSYSCPSGQNWTVSGTNCTRPDCVSPQSRDPADGVCKAPACPAAGTAAPQAWYEGAGQLPSSLCINNCSYGIGDFGIGLANSWSSRAGKSTGASCATNTATGIQPTDPKTDCVTKGMGYGTVNGVVVCVPATSETKNKSTVSTPASGGASTVTTGETVNCDTNGSCVKTTTTTTTTGGSGPGGTGTGSTTTVGTVTATEQKATFCEENPQSPMCLSTSFSGVCAAGAAPSCTGDAVQCAQAAASWKIQCDIETEPSDAAYTLGKALSAGGVDAVVNPAKDPNAPTYDIASIVSAAGGTRTLTATCIPSPTFVVRGVTYTLSTSMICQLASVVGYLMIAASSIIAVRMVAS